MRHAPQHFDDLTEGQSWEEGPRRLSREDIATFADVSGDQTALHTDDAYAATTPLGGLAAHGVLNLAVATGLAYEMGVFEGTVLAIRSMQVKYDRPVFPGDELTLTLDVRELDPRPRPDRGRVEFGVTLRNQGGKTVLSGQWSVLVRRRAAAGSSQPS